jgi:hypothetical protein
MIEYNLDISPQRKRLHLLIRQLHIHRLFLNQALFARRIREYFGHLHTLALIHIEVGNAAATPYMRHTFKLHGFQPFHRRWFNLLIVVAFEVVDISELAGLRTPLATSETLIIIKTETVVHWVTVTEIVQDSTDCNAGTTLARVTVHNYDVFRVN